MNCSWLDDCVIYQFFPLGLCGSPRENSWDWSNTWNAATKPVKRIDRILLWIEQLKRLNVNAVHFGPVMQSDTNGYNLRDFYTLDSRLGSNEDFSDVCRILHKNNFRIILDARFNYVGRGFWAFRNLRSNMQNSAYIDWFNEIDFERNTPCNDGFYYNSYFDNWGFPSLNLKNEGLLNHIAGAIRKWVDMFAIDGLQVGRADLVNDDFLQSLRFFCSDLTAGLGGNIAIMGEVADCDDCNKFVSTKQAHGITNYELRDAICEAFNSKNLFPLVYTLRRQYAQGGIYSHTSMINVLDSHGVSRFASQVSDDALLPLGWALVFALPGSPSIFYGSEWGAEAFASETDFWQVSMAFEKPEWNSLADAIEKFSMVRKISPALRFGTFKELFSSKEQLIFERSSCGQNLIVAMNLSDSEYNINPKQGAGYASFAGLRGRYRDLLTGQEFALSGNILLAPKSIQYLEHI